jgi:hypothetical protein
MLPVILWQGWETLGEVREEAEGAMTSADNYPADAQNF